MKKHEEKVLVRIKNGQSEVTHRGIFKTLADATAWINLQESKPLPWLYANPSDYTKEVIDLETSDDAEAVEHRAYLARRLKDISDSADLKSTAIDAINGSNLPVWHKKLLKYLVRQIG